MVVTAPHEHKSGEAISPWHGFRPGFWQTEIDVRDFIQQNYDPYEGDESFLAPATARTQRIWATLTALFVVEFVEPRAEVSVLVLACATSELGNAWECRKPPNRESTTRSSKQSHDSSVRRRRRFGGGDATARQGAISVYQALLASFIGVVSSQR